MRKPLKRQILWETPQRAVGLNLRSKHIYPNKLVKGWITSCLSILYLRYTEFRLHPQTAIQHTDPWFSISSIRTLKMISSETESHTERRKRLTALNQLPGRVLKSLTPKKMEVWVFHDSQTQQVELHLLCYLIIDGGAELNHQETVGNDGKDTQDGSEEDRQPNVGLVQGVSCCSWINTHIHKVCIITGVKSFYLQYSWPRLLSLYMNSVLFYGYQINLLTLRAMKTWRILDYSPNNRWVIRKDN